MLSAAVELPESRHHDRHFLEWLVIAESASFAVVVVGAFPPGAVEPAVDDVVPFVQLQCLLRTVNVVKLPPSLALPVLDALAVLLLAAVKLTLLLVLIFALLATIVSLTQAQTQAGAVVLLLLPTPPPGLEDALLVALLPSAAAKE